MNLKSKKRTLTLLLSGIAVLGAVGYGAWWYTNARFLQSTDDAYVGGDISAISAKVSGYIQEIAIKDNMPVKKGELLVRLDARDYQAALAKAEGEVAAQQAAMADLIATRQLQLATIEGSAASLGPRRLLR
jgi:membrane fusion protein (multidrug efflux system)